MAPVSDLEMVGRLVLAALVGFLIGLEREVTGRPAGERTHALVSLGAATFALISVHAFPGGLKLLCERRHRQGRGAAGAGRFFG